MNEGTSEGAVAASRRQFVLGSLAALAAGPALAQIPAARRSYAFSGRASSTLWRPFDFWRRNQIFLAGTFNGRRTEMLLDSGAESSVVDLSLAAEVGLTPDAPLNVRGLSDQVSGHGMSFRESALDLDGLVLRTNRIAILDLSPFAGPMGRPVPLVLGRDLFDQVMVDLDFELVQVAFHDARRTTAASGMRSLRIGRTDGLPNIPLNVEGGRSILARFDLGDSDALTLSPDYVAGHRTLRLREGAPTRFLGVEGFVNARRLTVDGVTIAGTSLNAVPTRVPETWTNQGADRPQANLGIEIIRQFRVTTDFPRRRIWLRRRAAFEPYYRDRTGFIVEPRGDFREVVMVVPNGPAAKAGLKVGDRVIAIDGRPVGPYPTSPDPYRTAPLGTPLRLTLEGGAERLIIQADYY